MMKLPLLKIKELCNKSGFCLVLLSFFYLYVVITFVYAPNPSLKFNQNRYEAIVIKACTGEFAEIDHSQTLSPELQSFQSGLRDFLQEKSGEVSCNGLPKGTAFLKGDSLHLSEDYAHGQYYMSVIIAAIWSLFGVKWALVKIAYLLMYGLSLFSSYFLMRLFMPSFQAVIFAWALYLSPDYSEVLLRLRDFSKTPFIYMVLYCAYILLLKKKIFRGNLVYIAAAGVTAGVGCGFRCDLLVIVPLFLLSLLILFPRSLDHKWWHKPSGAIVFTAAFITFALPAFSGWKNGTGNIHHVLLLGQMDIFDKELDITPGPYGFGYRYHDAYACILVNAYQQQNNLPVSTCAGESYNSANAELVMKYFFLTLGDQLLRSVSAFVMALKRDYGLGGDNSFPSGYVSAVIMLISIIVMGEASVPLACFVFFSLAYLAGTTAIQYSVRHSAYLDLYFWLLFGYLLHASFIAFKKMMENGVNKKNLWLLPAGSRVMFGILLAALTLMWAGIEAGRVFQEHSFSKLVVHPNDEKMRSVEFNYGQSGNSYREIIPHLENKKMGGFSAYFLSLNFDMSLCGAKEIHLGVKYPGKINFSELMILSSAEKGTFSFYIPVYSKQGVSKFKAFTLRPNETSCLVSIEETAFLQAVGLPLRMVISSADASQYRKTSGMFLPIPPSLQSSMVRN